MQIICARSLTDHVKSWLTASQHARVLHVFEDACNLINAQGEVLSVVTQNIGDGPFNLVIKEDILFSDHLNAESKIFIQPNQVALEDLYINIDKAQPWSSYPNWEILRGRKDKIQRQLAIASISEDQPSLSTSLRINFRTALVNADVQNSINSAKQLAGLGAGLTPAGDDFMLGAVLAARIIHPKNIAEVLAKEITKIAAQRTTSLSAAWLRSAGRGEAGILWHNFFNAVIADDPADIQFDIAQLLSVGHTSGADAFAGFMSILIHAEEKSCPS